MVLASVNLLLGGSALALDAFSYELPSAILESVSATVNCTSSQLGVVSMVGSTDQSLVHFPPGLNVNRAELTNAVSMMVGFSRQASWLVFIFNNTDAATARSLADAVKPSVEAAFDASFTWSSMGPIEEGYVNVTYTGLGKGNLLTYASWLMDRCLAPDLGGFTSTFLPMIGEASAFIQVGASKESGGFNWVTLMAVGYYTNIPVGAGQHKIDFLDLLNVQSLEPSRYASLGGWYSSTVTLVVASNEPVEYVSSEPSLASPPSSLYGWHVNPIQPQPPVQLIAQFMFATDPTPVNRLSLTFSGLVIPEFATVAPILAIMLATSLAVVAFKRGGRQ
ncbi:MAG: hypothetical protein QFX33_00480 [Candidatus Nezhaarchaeota archaeon]|nr:hypothetical protein [Candidatus Nezhaarchaeota archaeon]